MIVVIGNTKGGVGKTTLATQLALARQATGRTVLLIDADRQGSSQGAATARAEAGREPPLACVHQPIGRPLRAQIPALAATYDDTLIDAGGQDSEALRVAMFRADLLVVPVQPRAVDVWALGDMADLIDRAQEAREDDNLPRLRVLAVVNLADPGDNRDTVETIEALTGLPQFTVSTAVIRRRKAIANAMAVGAAVAEAPQRERDPKACEEIAQLVSTVFDMGTICNDDHTTEAAE
jgi:chromosome partitioning protein